MKKFLIILFLLSLAHICFAFPGIKIEKGKRNLAYFVLPEAGAGASSALAFDYGLNKDRGIEVTYLAIGQVYLLSPNYQIGIHGKFDIGNFLGLSFRGLVGLGLSQTTQSGTAVPFDLGCAGYRELNNRICFSCPFVVSIYSNGALINYLPGIILKTPAAEITLGLKGIAALTSTSSHNRFLWALGVGTEF